MRRATKTSANLDNTKVEGWSVIKRVIPYLWPEDELWVKRRVVAAMAVLFFAKLIAVGTPILYKGAVDALGKFRTQGPWNSRHDAPCHQLSRRP